MDPPTVSVSSSICFYMQAGLVKDTVKLDVSDLTLKTLKEHACNFVDRKVSCQFGVFECVCARGNCDDDDDDDQRQLITTSMGYTSNERN